MRECARGCTPGVVRPQVCTCRLYAIATRQWAPQSSASSPEGLLTDPATEKVRKVLQDCLLGAWGKLCGNMQSNVQIISCLKSQMVALPT